MTLKCWTSAVAQTPTSAVAAASAPPTTSPNASQTVPNLLTAHARAAAAANSSNGFADMRRRSVGFINTSALLPATGPLVTTPSRNPNVHKINRLRSLSSTWDASDMDDEDDAAEEKTGDTYGELSRRELMYTQIASSLNANQLDGGSLLHTPRRRGNHNSRNARSRRRRTMSESSGSTSSNNTSRRVRILTPLGSKISFGGWVRGQPAEVRWEVVDKSVQSVRIDVCNVAWTVPTTIATRVPNDGNFQWKRVYWGMPITDGYYVNIYDVTDVSPEQQASPDPQQQTAAVPRPPDQPPSNGNQQSTLDGIKTDLVLLARSDCFAVVG